MAASAASSLLLSTKSLHPGGMGRGNSTVSEDEWKIERGQDWDRIPSADSCVVPPALGCLQVRGRRRGRGGCGGLGARGGGGPGEAAGHHQVRGHLV
jgi:hypothetical protein